MRLSMIVSIIFLAPYVASSKTINVPGDYSKIQDAITAAASRDIVLVAAGTYVENIDFQGKAITVMSSDGPDATSIDGNQKNSVVLFVNGEDPGSVLDGFTITNGKASSGAGIKISISSPKIIHNIIMGNNDTGTRGGGGIYCGSGSMAEICNNVIEGNTSDSRGGGIFCIAGSSPLIMANIISDNKADECGGVYCSIDCAPIIHDNSITGNTCYKNGGAIHCENSSPTITKNHIRDNLASKGAGIYCWAKAAPIIENNNISENWANYGAGIFFDRNTISELTNNVISDNTAVWYGGGIFFHTTELTLTNNIITGNRAHEAGGLDFFKSTVILTNNTVAGNAAQASAGGIRCTSFSFVSAANEIIRNNTAPIGPQISVGNSSNPSQLNLRYCNLEGGKPMVNVDPGCLLYWGKGMIDSDPLFVDQVSGDYHLLYTSPCRNAGDNSASGLPGKDFEGDPRLADGTVDIGADEFHRHLYVTGNPTPGGLIQINIMGDPGPGPVILLLGSSVLDPPLKTPYGDWYLGFPVLFEMNLGVVPPVGMTGLKAQIPYDAPVPLDIPLQAGVALELTNLFVISLK